MIVKVNLELEEYKTDLFVEVIAVVEVTPGEPEIRYYPDGSGYPGSPPDAALIGIVVGYVTDVNGDEVEIDEEELYYYLEENYDLWIEKAFDRAND